MLVNDLPSVWLTPVMATFVVRPRIIQEAERHKLLSSSETRDKRGVLGRVWRRGASWRWAAVKRVGQAIRRAVKPSTGLVAGLVFDLTRSRTELLAENALLRQQLIVLRRCAKRPKIRPHERGVMVALAALTRRLARRDAPHQARDDPALASAGLPSVVDAKVATAL